MHGTFQSNGGVPTKALGQSGGSSSATPAAPTVGKVTRPIDDPRTKAYREG